MGFADDIRQQTAAAMEDVHAIHETLADLAFDEIVHGGPISGAPGQPVAAPIFEKAGYLRDSYTKQRVDADTIVISSDSGYAPVVEDNLRGVRFRDGGAHSVKLVVLASDRLLAAATQQVAGGGP